MATIIVQQIRAHWTKASRGGENAVKRNAIPEIAKIPVQRITEDNIIFARHALFYEERRGFSCPHEDIRINPTIRPFAIGCVAVDCSEEQIIMSFRYDGNCGGAPDRRGAQKTLYIARHEWGQIIYNGRFAPDWDGGWWYEKTVVNVGLFERLTPSVFTRSKPNCHFSAMSELF